MFFRANTQRCARALGLVGWVRNSPDGRVEAVFEGEDAEVERAIDWCEHGQPYAKVVSKKVEMTAPTGEFSDFEVV